MLANPTNDGSLDDNNRTIAISEIRDIFATGMAGPLGRLCRRNRRASLVRDTHAEGVVLMVGIAESMGNKLDCVLGSIARQYSGASDSEWVDLESESPNQWCKQYSIILATSSGVRCGRWRC